MSKRFTMLLLLFIVALTPLQGCKKKDPGTLFSESGRKGTVEAPVKDVPKDMLATQQAFINLVKAGHPGSGQHLHGQQEEDGPADVRGVPFLRRVLRRQDARRPPVPA